MRNSSFWIVTTMYYSYKKKHLIRKESIMTETGTLTKIGVHHKLFPQGDTFAYVNLPLATYTTFGGHCSKNSRRVLLSRNCIFKNIATLWPSSTMSSDFLTQSRANLYGGLVITSPLSAFVLVLLLSALVASALWNILVALVRHVLRYQTIIRVETKTLVVSFLSLIH